MNATLQPIEVSNLARPVWVETLMPETGRQHQRPIPGAQGRTSNDAIGQPHTSRRISITTAPRPPSAKAATPKAQVVCG